MSAAADVTIATAKPAVNAPTKYGESGTTARIYGIAASPSCIMKLKRYAPPAPCARGITVPFHVPTPPILFTLGLKKFAKKTYIPS
jgi:hypothetical protein